MKGSFALSTGGLLGSFGAVCAMAMGVPKLDFLLFSLFFVSISSFIALIAEDRTYMFANAGIRNNYRAYSRVSLLQGLARMCFGASLAAAFICAMAQASIKISSVFSLDLISAGALSTLLFLGYVSLVVLLLSMGQRTNSTS